MMPLSTPFLNPNFRISTPQVVDELDSLTGLTGQSGSGGAFVTDAGAITLQSTYGPNDNWVQLRTGTGDAYGGGLTGGRVLTNFSSIDMSTIFNISVRAAWSTDVWGTASDPANLFAVVVYLGSDADVSLSNAFAKVWTPDTGTSVDNNIAEILIRLDEFVVAAGSPDWSNITSMAIEIIGSNGTIGGAQGPNDAAVSFSGFYCDVRSKPVMVISHDEGNDGIYDVAKPVLDSYGLKSTQFLATDDIGDSGKMTQAELTTMYGDGHDICLHATASGVDLNTQTNAVNATDLASGTQYLDANKINRAKHVVSWPAGVVVDSGGNSVYDTFADGGITVGRTLRYGGATITARDSWTTVDVTGEAKQGARNMGMQAYSINSADSSVSGFNAVIQFLLNNGGVLFINFNDVVASGATGTETNLADYETVIKQIAELNSADKIEVLTMSELYNADGTTKTPAAAMPVGTELLWAGGSGQFVSANEFRLAGTKGDVLPGT